jgi:hypothetical protein
MWRESVLLAGSILLLAAGQMQGDDPFNPDAPAQGEIRDAGVDFGVAHPVTHTPAEQQADSAHPASRCRYEPVPGDFERERVLHTNDLVPTAAVFFYRVCGEVRELDWYLRSEVDPADTVDLGSLVAAAVGRVAPPEPRLVTSPPLGSEVLTGLPMYLAVDDQAFSEQSGSVSAGQFTVTAVVRPVETRFVPGDQHDAFSCEGAGSLWSHGDRPTDADCTHTYTHTPTHLGAGGERYELVAQVVYEASYTVEGPILGGTYELGRFDGPEHVVQVPVIERRAVRTATGG